MGKNARQRAQLDQRPEGERVRCHADKMQGSHGGWQSDLKETLREGEGGQKLSGVGGKPRLCRTFVDHLKTFVF